MTSLQFAADTMAVVLDYEKRPLPSRIKAIFQAAQRGEVQVGVSVMVLAEIGYLFEKKRISLSVETLVAEAAQRGLVVLPLDALVIRATFQIKDIPELHDRIIAATAQCYQVPLLTNDPLIQASTAGPTWWE